MEVTKLQPESAASESNPETSPKLTAVNTAAEPTATASTAAVVSLRLVNQSSAGAPQVVIVQSSGSSANSPLIAWRVIEHLSPGWSHPFTYPLQTQVSVTDPWGNVSPALTLESGQQADVVMGTYGTELVLSSEPASSPNALEVVNDLSQGAITVEVLKDGLAIARTTDVAPEMRVDYAFKPAIRIGVASGCIQGEAVDAAVASQIDMEISLLGIASADIVMSGAGEGGSAPPFTFSLTNVVMA